MVVVIVHSDFGAQENKVCRCIHLFPFYLPLNDGTVNVNVKVTQLCLTLKPHGL